jgi:hypothetical protein
LFLGTLSLEVKVLEHVANLSPPPAAKPKNSVALPPLPHTS